MSIKIDLLPGYVPLRRTFKRVLLGCGLLLLAVATFVGLTYMADQRRLDKLKQDVEAIQTFANQTLAAETAAQKAQDEAAPVKAVVDFMTDASKTGPERAAVIDLMRRYIYAGAVVNSIDMSTGTSATIQTLVRTPDEYARLLLALRRGSAQENGPLFTDPPIGTGVPGFPEGRIIQPVQGPIYTPTPIEFPLPITLQGNLKPDSAQRPLLYVPTEPPGTAVAGGNAAGGGAAGGAPPRYPGGSSSGSSSSGSPSSAPYPSASPGASPSG
jgi:hypothetical protein